MPRPVSSSLTHALVFSLLSVGLASLASPAHAQSLPAPAVELEQFHGSPFSDRTLRLDGTTVLPNGKLRLGVDLDYADRPLIVKDAANDTTALVRNAVGAQLRFSVGLADRLELGALVPVTAYQAGDTLARVQSPTQSGLDAIRAGLKLHLLGNGSIGPGLGASVLAVIPTGAAGGLVHEHGFGAEARLFGDVRVGALTIAAGAGARLREKTTLYDVALGDELLANLAVDVQLNVRTSVFGELSGATALTSPLASTKQTPLEVLFGGRERFGALQLFGAAGPGLLDGYGTPVFRVVAGASWSNAPLDVDHDGVPDDVDKCPIEPEDRDGFQDEDGCPDPDNDNDGIPDAKDRCPDQAEDKDGFEDDDGCPDFDNDHDGIPDKLDKCPNQPETKNGYKDEDGCPDKNLHDIDTDKDGVMDDVDKCPKEPEDKDGFQDEDGCPDPDNDKDGIPDAKDKCPNEPETYNNVKDDDGCPDKGIVTLKDGEIETLTPIFFATDRARVRHAFRPALDDIAAILKDHPEIGRCAIEGHTDATGPEAWNKKLSLERAKSVAVYLISKGVDPARVVAIGQGEALPWATNQTEAGRAANRRVIFHIEGVSDDQEKKELEIQRQRALKATGAPLEPDPAAAKPPEVMGPPVPPGLVTEDAKTAKQKSAPSAVPALKPMPMPEGPPAPPGLVTDDSKSKGPAKTAAPKAAVAKATTKVTTKATPSSTPAAAAPKSAAPAANVPASKATTAGKPLGAADAGTK
ncbi:MAG TPA: OmpA family protein [Polyangia bacterium]|nr:OmpA family protein [Polyangia bacterium]